MSIDSQVQDPMGELRHVDQYQDGCYMQILKHQDVIWLLYGCLISSNDSFVVTYCI